MKISIIIPAYNEEKYIGKTLESINNLEKKAGWEIEVIVVNGDSTDKTVEVAKQYSARVLNEPHKGIGFARQQGLLHAQGGIVAFTDADTIVPKDWLKKHLTALADSEVVCSYGNFRVSEGSFPYFPITNYLQPLSIALAYKVGIFRAPGQNIACKREPALAIGGFDEKLMMFEDADFVKRLGKVGKVRYLQNCVVTSSGRRSKEGWRFILRAGIADIQFFVFGVRKFRKFPNFR